MKTKIYILCLFLICHGVIQGQFSQNFESIGCNRDNLTGANGCWSFSAITATNTPTSAVVSGACSAYSSALSNPNNNQYVLRTPYLSLTSSSTITVTYKVNNTSSNPSLTIKAMNTMGVITDILLAPTPTTSNQTVNYTFSLSSGVYRIMFVPSGNGGSSRMSLDNISITNTSVQESFVGGTCVLPLKLLSFTVASKPRSNELKWVVDEEDMSHYTVESSADAVTFEPVATIQAKNIFGMHTYTYEHQDAQSERYYRLGLHHPDGSTTYSDIAFAKSDISSDRIVFPNPSSDVFYAETGFPNVAIAVYNAVGSLVYQQRLSSGTQLTAIDLQHQPAGLYMLTITDADMKTTSRKIYKK